MTPGDLTAILLSHEKWLQGIHGGVRADLTLQELYGLDLSEANLKQAKLAAADPSGANLTRANLEGVDLSVAIIDDETPGVAEPAEAALAGQDSD